MPRRKSQTKEKSDNFIKFLGTAGARFVMIRQLRASGGMWVRAKGANILVDPGPGSIVRCSASRPKLDPSKLDAIILTHRHLDHSNDINVMVEAMTEGGFKKRGVLFLPNDCLQENSLLLDHVKNFIGKIQILEEYKEYSIKDFCFQTGPRNHHSVETYGLKFQIKNHTISLIGDTAFYPQIFNFYKSNTVIINTVFYEPRPGVQHLSLQETKTIIEGLKPQRTILTHFGMGMLKAKPHLQAEELSRELGIEVIAAYDGMTLNF